MPRTPPASPHPARRSPGTGAFSRAAAPLFLALLAFSAPASAADCSAYAGPGVDWQECDKRTLMLRGSDLAGAILFDADLSSTDLRDTNLAGANLEKATLIRASFAGAKADKANFSRIEAYRTSFAAISAQGSSFASAELQRADFTGAQLTGADFQKAELGRAMFGKATITGTRFSFANLARAELAGTVFEGAIDFTNAFLFLTRIEGVDLTAATGLQQWQVDIACGDANTKLPAGLKPASTWPCPFD